MNQCTVSMDRLLSVLGSVRRKGVKLWSENGQLHYKAGKGVLSQGEVEELRALKVQIVSLLDVAAGMLSAEPKVEPRQRRDRAPLAFSQEQHWNSYQLAERRALRGVATVTRLRGQLNISIFQRSLEYIVERHDALRTRIVAHEHTLMQEISDTASYNLELRDLTMLPQALRENTVQQLIMSCLLQPIDVTVDPLFAAHLLIVDDQEHVLILAMEHIISDGVSLGIVMRDLLTAYKQAIRDEPMRLPDIPIQFPDYADWQRKEQQGWMQRHGAYWSEHLAGCRRLRFPADRTTSRVADEGWFGVPVRISRDLLEELRESCHFAGSTVVLTAFAAYVVIVLRWCGVSDAVFQYQIDGRFSSKVANTVGYFASALSLRMQLNEHDAFMDVVRRAAEEYAQACKHADCSQLAAQLPRPEYTYNTTFNWLRSEYSQAAPSFHERSDKDISHTSVPFEHPLIKKLELDQEPFILLGDADDGVVGAMYFPAKRFSVPLMERFVRNFLAFMRATLQQPTLLVKDFKLI